MEFSIKRAECTEDWRMAKDLVNKYHSYIQWADRPSRKMYWLLLLDGEIVGVWGLGSAFAKPKAMATYMDERSIEFNEIANNIVYCLKPDLPPNSGTRFLKLLRKDAIEWWNARYGDTLKAIQTFILPPRTGAMYKADNWTYIGETSGSTQIVRTIRPANLPENLKGIERRVMKSGEIKYLRRTPQVTPKKLMFVWAVK